MDAQLSNPTAEHRGLSSRYLSCSNSARNIEVSNGWHRQIWVDCNYSQTLKKHHIEEDSLNKPPCSQCWSHYNPLYNNTVILNQLDGYKYHPTCYWVKNRMTSWYPGLCHPLPSLTLWDWLASLLAPQPMTQRLKRFRKCQDK